MLARHCTNWIHGSSTGFLTGSVFGGVVDDTNGDIGLYAGYGAGLGAGVGLSASAQVGVSNGTGITSIGGPFVDIGAGGGAGGVAGADYFGGSTDGQLVQGATVSVGAGLRGSASAQITNTYVFPLYSGSCR